jgi:hypothetical protein
MSNLEYFSWLTSSEQYIQDEISSTIYQHYIEMREREWWANPDNDFWLPLGKYGDLVFSA